VAESGRLVPAAGQGRLRAAGSRDGGCLTSRDQRMLDSTELVQSVAQSEPGVPQYHTRPRIPHDRACHFALCSFVAVNRTACAGRLAIAVRTLLEPPLRVAQEGCALRTGVDILHLVQIAAIDVDHVRHGLRFAFQSLTHGGHSRGRRPAVPRGHPQPTLAMPQLPGQGPGDTADHPVAASVPAGGEAHADPRAGVVEDMLMAGLLQRGASPNRTEPGCGLAAET